MLSPPPCHSHHVAQGKSPSTHCSLSLFFLMHHVASASSLYRSATNFFFFFRHHVAQSKSPRHTALSVLDRICFFSRHFVAQSKSPQHTALPVLDRIFVFSTPPRGTEQMSSGNSLLYRASTEFFTFSTPLRGTAKVCDLPLHRFPTEPPPFIKWKFTLFHCTKPNVHELPKLCNRSSTEANNSSNDSIYQTSKKKQKKTSITITKLKQVITTQDSQHVCEEQNE